jgi:hypothetical protein
LNARSEPTPVAITCVRFDLNFLSPDPVAGRQHA